MTETNAIYCVLEYVCINVLSPTDVEGMRPMLPLSHDSVEAPIRQVSAEEMYSAAAAAPPRAARPVTSRNSTLRYASTDDFYTDLPHEGGLFRRSSSRRAARDDEW